MNPASSSTKPTCAHCGAENEQIIRRLRGIIHSPVANYEWDRVVQYIRTNKTTLANALQYFKMEKVETRCVETRCVETRGIASLQQPAQKITLCTHCLAQHNAQLLRNRKNQKPMEQNNKLF